MAEGPELVDRFVHDAEASPDRTVTMREIAEFLAEQSSRIVTETGELEQQPPDVLAPVDETPAHLIKMGELSGQRKLIGVIVDRLSTHTDKKA